jgi:hypothetical protein
MLDILDKKTGKVVAVFMDDGTVIKKKNAGDDLNQLIKEHLEKTKKRKK